MRLFLPHDLLRHRFKRWSAGLCVALSLAIASGCGKDQGYSGPPLAEQLDANDAPTSPPGAPRDPTAAPAQASHAEQASAVAQAFSDKPILPDQFRRGDIQFSAGGFVKRPPLAPPPRSEPAAPAGPYLAQPAPRPTQPFAGRTELASFDHSPFPFNGSRPNADGPFFSVREQGRLGHRTSSGRVYWAHESYNERRSLLHVPEGFDPDRPSVLVLFFHGHRARLERDIRDRYLIADQITASGMNAVVVAPQFAVEANDSSIGRFWDAGFMKLYLDEAAQKLARMMGRSDKRPAFERMPIVVVGYSGGFEPAGQALTNSGVRERIRGVVLLDAAYGRFDAFAQWMQTTPQGFFVSAYTSSTARGNRHLMEAAIEAGQSPRTQMPSQLKPGARIFLSVPVSHESYVTQAWAPYPLADLLRRLPDLPQRKNAEPQATSSVPTRARN